jgi:hypothetical protein
MKITFSNDFIHQIVGLKQCWALLRIRERYLSVINLGIHPLTPLVFEIFKEPILVYNSGSQTIQTSQRTIGSFMKSVDSLWYLKQVKPAVLQNSTLV